jgi:uncharacterized membrane protein YccC
MRRSVWRWVSSAAAASLPCCFSCRKVIARAGDAAPADTAVRWSLAPLRAHLNLGSAIMHFALSRALVAAFAIWLGWRLALAHPFWIAVTFLIVVVPDRQQAARTSWQRAIGTVIGVGFGAAVLAFPLQPITLLLLWLLVTLLMLAVQSVNSARCTPGCAWHDLGGPKDRTACF